MGLSLPSKTFLVGEYGVLEGGEALLLNTHPRFEFKEGHFFDPHRGQGGFGASSAKWLVEKLSCQGQTFLNEDDKIKLLNKALDRKLATRLRQYYQEDTKVFLKKLSKDNETFVFSERASSYLPSGVDLLSQCTGYVAHIKTRSNICRTSIWPFKSLSFFIFLTGHKVVTHQHLSIGRFDYEKLRVLADACQKVVDAFLQKKSRTFLKTLREFDEFLEAYDLCCQPTLQIKKTIRETFPTAVVKGCGAWGMDTVLVICQSDLSDKVKAFLQEKFLTKTDQKYLMTHTDLTEGLQTT